MIATWLPAWQSVIPPSHFAPKRITIRNCSPLAEAVFVMEAQAKVAKRREVRPSADPADAAHRLLREDVDRLGVTEDIDGFLGELLLAIQKLLDGHSASIWRRDPRDPAGYRLELSVEGGRVLPAGALSGEVGAGSPKKSATNQISVALSGEVGAGSTRQGGEGSAAKPWIELRRIGLGDLPYQRVIAQNRLPETEDASLLQQGVRSYAIIDLVLADLRLGVLIVRLAHERPVLDQYRDLIGRLALRAALALHLSGFAKAFGAAAAARALEEETRARAAARARAQAAITRERQAAAAKARAEKLARANALLRETSERLGAVEDLDAFLGRVLLTMYEVAGGHSATLWLVDPEDPDHYTIHHVVEDGRVIAGAQSSHPRSKIGSTPTPRRRSDPRLYGRTSKPHQVDLMANNGLMHEDERAYLLGLGVRQLVSAPLGIGDRVLGRFTIRLTDDRQLSDEDLDLVQALAGQAAVALDLARLAEEARQAAIAREREAVERSRADALHRANEVLRTLLKRLSEQQDLPAFLGEALTVCAREMGAVGAGIWIRLGPGEHGLLMSWEAGEIRAPVDGDYIARLGDLGLDRELARGRIGFISLADYAELMGDWDPAFRRYIELHIAAAVQVPMFIGDRWLGTLIFRHSTESPDYPPERQELALAFGNQIALALEMQRLAAAAREAALSEARASAARQRTQAAERTAETLRASLDMLAAEPELERFLGHVLRAANTQLDVRRSTLWLHDPERQVNRLHMMCDEGRVTADPVELSRLPRTVITERQWPFWRRLVEKREPLTFDDATNHPDLAEVRDGMRRNGVRSLLMVPLMLGSEILGAVGIHNTERESWTEDEVSLAKALGHQATLALQLTRLANKAREGAVLQERNRLAREIHDTLAQGFAAIRLQLELARGEPGAAAQALDFASQIAAENLVEARRSMAVLTSERPSLVTSLSAAIEGVRRLGHTRVVAEIDPAPEPPPDVAHELLRICQEAMLNAVRHAEASAVRVTLAAAPGGGLRVAVTDDGKGFDPDIVTRGFGLAGLRERAGAINAELTIISEPGAGTEVITTWAPLS
jgi:signal transduction histidine kinase